MTGLNVKTISTLEDEELDRLISSLKQEKDKRANAKREKLINAFLAAWSNLRENDITVTYEDEEIDTLVDLYKRDCFYFY